MLLDKDIREPLFEFLEERYGKVRILEEKTVGRSRADVVMVIPEKIVGIEIKSDADTYTRLERQSVFLLNMGKLRAPQHTDRPKKLRIRIVLHLPHNIEIHMSFLLFYRHDPPVCWHMLRDVTRM